MKSRSIMTRKTIGITILLMALICGCRQDNHLQVYETIQEAAEKGDLADVKRHLKRGADVNDKNYNENYTAGLTALHLAAGNGNKELVEFLIKKGATINAKAEDGLTPLHWAVVKGFKDVKGDHKGVIELLIAKGADVNAKTKDNRGDGGTPLHFAVRTTHPDKEIITLLIAKGADVNAKDSFGKTPLHWATLFHKLDMITGIEDDEKDYESVAALLKKHGAKE